jgi:hypothetical protein
MNKDHRPYLAAENSMLVGFSPCFCCVPVCHRPEMEPQFPEVRSLTDGSLIHPCTVFGAPMGRQKTGIEIRLEGPIDKRISNPNDNNNQSIALTNSRGL